MRAAPVKVEAITVERVPEGIRARAWAASGVARYWQPVEESVLSGEDALTRWVASLDTRHAATRGAVLVSPELKADAPLMEAIRRGMKRPG
jgi:hypothetical protein